MIQCTLKDYSGELYQKGLDMYTGSQEENKKGVEKRLLYGAKNYSQTAEI